MNLLRDTALLASNVRFGVKLTMQTVSVAANTAIAAISSALGSGVTCVSQMK